MVTLRGVALLPRQVLVAEDCLGQTVAGSTAGETEFELAFPILPEGPSGDGGEALAPPTGMTDLTPLVRDRGWGYMGFGQSSSGPRPLASWIQALGVTGSWSCAAGADAEEAHQATVFGARFDEWLEMFGQWLELWSNQRVVAPEQQLQRTQGHVHISIDSKPAVLTGWSPALGSFRFHRSSESLPLATLRAAAARASSGTTPPLEWRLLLQAAQMSDRRGAMIDAGTAAEVGLANAIRVHLNGLPPQAQEVIIQAANGVAGLATLLESLVPAERSRRSRLIDRVAGPRNAAVHGGATPEPEALAAALAEVRALLDLYSPRPTPDDTCA